MSELMKRIKPIIMAYDGSKSNSSFNLALMRMFKALALMEIITVIEPSGGALGILATFYLEFRAHIKRYILSDYDDRIIGLYSDIINNHLILMKECYAFIEQLQTEFCSKQNHKVTKAFKKEIFARLSLSPSVQILFEHAVSRSSTLTLEKYIENFKKRIEAIPEIYHYVFDAKLLHELDQSERDTIQIIKRFRHLKNAFFLIDPPYYLTKVYDENTPGYEYHEKMLDALLQVKGYFALFFRINASREHNSKNNDVLDDALFQFYKDHLYGKGLYVYCDDFSAGKMFINFRNRGTYEVIVTNFEYQNTHPLDEVFDRYRDKIQQERQSKPITTIAQELGIED